MDSMLGREKEAILDDFQSLALATDRCQSPLLATKGKNIQFPDFRREQGFNFEPTSLGVKICNCIWIWGVNGWYSWYYEFKSHLHKDSIVSHGNGGDHLLRDSKNEKRGLRTKSCIFTGIYYLICHNHTLSKSNWLLTYLFFSQFSCSG